MQQLFDPKCSPREYHRQGKDYEFPDLANELCPQCMKALLKPHGFYKRWLCVPGFSGFILIRRHLCKACGKTVSLLPFFAHPRMGYGIEFILGILGLFYLEEMRPAQAVKCFHRKSGLICTRQLLRQFRARLKKNLNRLIMQAIALFGWKAPPVTAPENEKRQRAKQFLESIRSYDPKDVSLKLFERSGTTLLSSLAN
jgi:hypothetical protein